jgi:hypothetical protein
LRQDIRAKRKQVVAANMTLTADEATRFWPFDHTHLTSGKSTTALGDDEGHAENYRNITDSWPPITSEWP